MLVLEFISKFGQARS